jgi:outer membrane immunogenic protein
MKRLLYIFVFVFAGLMMVQSSAAQTFQPRFGVVAAILKSSIVGESDSWKDPIGAQAGIIVNLLDEFVPSMSIRGEANISMQGARWEDDWGEGLITGKTTLIYANLPIVLRYQHETGFFGEAGIQPGLLLSAKDKYEGETYNYKEWVNSFDFGIPLGAGYEFPNNNIGVGARIIIGVSNINKGDDVYKDHNLVFALRGTYTFNK